MGNQPSKAALLKGPAPFVETETNRETTWPSGREVTEKKRRGNGTTIPFISGHLFRTTQ